MPHDILLAASAFAELESLPDDLQDRLYAHFEQLADNPRMRGTKALAGVPGGMRIRVGSYRILYLIDDKNRKVSIYKIGPRRDVYR